VGGECGSHCAARGGGGSVGAARRGGGALRRRQTGERGTDAASLGGLLGGVPHSPDEGACTVPHREQRAREAGATAPTAPATQRGPPARPATAVVLSGPPVGREHTEKTGGHSGGLWGRHPMQWAARGSVKAAASCQAPARCRSRGRRGSGRRCVAFGGGPERAAYEGERRRPATPPRPCRVVAPTLHPVTAAGRGSAEAARRPDGRSLLFCLVDARARLAAAAASPIRLACALRGAARRRDCVRAHPQTPMPCPRQWAEPHALKQGGRAWCAGAASSAVSRGAEPPHPSCGPPNRGGGGPPLPSAARRPRPPACRGGYVRCAGGAPAGRGHQSATSRPAAATVG